MSREWTKGETYQLIELYEKEAVFEISNPKTSKRNGLRPFVKYRKNYQRLPDEKKKIHNLRSQSLQENKKLKTKKSGAGVDEV